MGKTHYPVYKIVAADSRFPRDGRFIESVGTYNPNLDPMEVTLKEVRIKYWLNVGAQPTDTVRNLFKKEGLMLRLRLEKKGVSAEEIESEVQKFLSLKESNISRDRDKKAKRKLKQKAGKDVKETDAKAEVKAEPKVEPKPEVKEEPKAEVKEEPKAEVKEEPKAEVKEEPKTEPKEEPKAEVKEEPTTEPKAEPKAE